MDDREVCGTCEHNQFSLQGFYCDCEVSDCYGCKTSYTDHCEEWERKEED